MKNRANSHSNHTLLVKADIVKHNLIKLLGFATTWSVNSDTFNNYWVYRLLNGDYNTVKLVPSNINMGVYSIIHSQALKLPKTK